MNLAVISRFARYLKPYIGKELILLLLMILANAASLVSPYILKIIIDKVFPSKDYSLLVELLLILLAINMVRLVISFISDYLYTWVSNNIVNDIRIDLYYHLIHLPLSYYDKNKTGDTLHRINNEVNTVQGIITGTVLRLINNTLTIIGLTIALCTLNYQLFLISLLVLPLVFINTKYFQPKIQKNIKQSRENDADILSYLVERLENVKLIKSYNRYDYEKEKLQGKNQELIAINLRNVILTSTTQNISMFFTSLTPLLIFCWGGKQIIAGSMTIGTLVAFIQYMNRFYSPLKDLMGLYWDTIRATVSMKRIFELLQMPVEKNKFISPSDCSLKNKDIVFKDINFTYDGHKVIDNLSLQLMAGKKYALVGTSGCGKSTLVNLMCNFYQPQNGTIFIGETDINHYDLHKLRSRIALVTQDNQLFNDTIWENIKYGKLDSSIIEIEEASELAGVNNQLSRIKDHYQAVIGDKGSKLSGGQKQRIAIARAVLKNADIIIFDEATSALDSESEQKVFVNLCHKYHDKTLIFISHRLSAIKDVDEIICLDRGKIVETGKHEELINNNGFYRDLFKNQIE